MDDDIISNIISLALKHRQRDEEALKRLDMHAGQEHILFFLWEEEGLTPTQLMNRCSVGLATIMKTLQRMEQAGLLVRRTNPTDRRATKVYLTDKGRSIYGPALQINTALTERTLRGMSDVEKVLFNRFLQQAIANLNFDGEK